MSQARESRSRAALAFAGILLLTMAGTRASSQSQDRPKAAGSTTISDRGVVTRTEASPIPNPLRHAPDEVLVRLRPGVHAAAAREALEAVPIATRRRLRLVDELYHVRLASGVSLHRALRAYGRHRDVLYAEPNYVVEAHATPNDPSFASQWALQNTGQNGGTPGADINATAAWDITTGSSAVVVAVIDSGVDYNHSDLAANVFQNALDCDADGVDDDGNGHADDCHGIDVVNGDSDPMDDFNHGTHVAGSIGAVGNNAVGVAGVNWSVGILPCKFLDAAGNGSTAGAIACLDYVAAMRDRGVNVVATNNSWGGGLFSQALRDAIQAHQQRGILFVASAGNSGRDNDVILSYPCSYDLPGVVCVGATTAQDGLASFSNYGRATVHVAAPGVGILSTIRGNAYANSDGTSMAAPHVTGTVALLHAQTPGRDWREVKNLILAGGEPRSSLTTKTISRRRLSALGALTCSASPLTARTKPARTPILSGVAAIELAALNINCGAPAGEVAVTVSSGGSAITLHDDGLGRDQVAGDGVYTALWMPPGGGAFDLSYPDGSVVHVDVDPQLEPGFPVQAFEGSGSYQGGQGIHTLVGDIDGDPAQEILVTALAQGPLYAWNSDGTPVPGWPNLDMNGAVYPALGELDATAPGLEVFAAHYGVDPDLVARRGSGLPLPGWPRNSANYVAAPAGLADVDGDGIDEIFTEEEDWKFHAYRANGTTLPGWPAVQFVGGQERHTPAIADLDGDGSPEIVTVSGWTSGGFGAGTYLLAYHSNGSAVAGFPIFISNGFVNTFPAIGDVDGDGQLEIVVPGRPAGPPNWYAGVHIFSANGTLERTIVGSGSGSYGTAPALADLDGDGVPEIILQTETTVHAWRGDGTNFPGWPRTLGSSLWIGDSAPVVGDVDGDGQPDIAITSQVAGSSENGFVYLYDRNGSLHAGFPKSLKIGSGVVPAIADIDLDGRNELIVASNHWSGVAGYFDKVWVYDLGGPTPHGPVEWGQFMGGPKHRGLYQPVPVTPAFQVAVERTGSGGGVVTSSPPGIACGADCSERYYTGTSLSLTAVPSAGSGFAGWSGGACAGQDNPCTFIVGADETVTAEFGVGFRLDVSRTGSGSGTVASAPAGIDCGVDCTETYPVSSSVTLIATPAADSVFAGWSGACEGQGNACIVTMSSDQSTSADFALVHRLDVSRTGTGSGTVTSSPQGIDCGVDCTETYPASSSVTLVATAAADSVFTGWGGACAGQGNLHPCTITMSGDQGVSAEFALVHRLDVSRTGAGSGTVASNPAGIDCGVDCTETYPASSSVTLTATPAANSVFAGWGGACAGQGNPCTVTMSSDQSVSADFALVHRLDVSRTGAGGGTVASNPAGIDCGLDCTETYAPSSSVTLTATPAADSVFTGWGGACAGQGNPCTVTMSSDQSTSADFALVHRLDVSRTGAGSGTVTSNPAGIDCGVDCTETYLTSTTVTLTATPAADSVFTGWGGACAGQGNPCTVTMGSDQSASADFALVHRLDVSRTGAGNGAVTSNPAGIDCGVDCTETYPASSSVTLTATAAADSVFTGWGGACAGQGNPCTVAMSGDQAATAQFTPAFLLSVGRTGAGAGSVSSNPAGIACGSDCSESYLAGTTVTLTATPNAGSVFVAWDGACSGQGSTCAVAMDGPRSANARFEPAVTLTVTHEGAGTGTVSSQPPGIACGADCSEVYALGTVVVLTATPAPGSRFQRWEGACTGSATTCTVTLDASKSVRARFLP